MVRPRRRRLPTPHPPRRHLRPSRRTRRRRRQHLTASRQRPQPHTAKPNSESDNDNDNGNDDDDDVHEEEDNEVEQKNANSSTAASSADDNDDDDGEDEEVYGENQRHRKRTRTRSDAAVNANSKRRQASKEPLDAKKATTTRRGVLNNSTTDHMNTSASATASSTRNPATNERLKLAEKLLAELIRDENAWPFLKPVSKKDAPDYAKIIKRPIDFATIKDNCNKLAYADYTMLVADIRLVFANCRQYNETDSDVYETGEKMSALFEQRLKQSGLVDFTPQQQGTKH